MCTMVILALFSLVGGSVTVALIRILHYSIYHLLGVLGGICCYVGLGQCSYVVGLLILNCVSELGFDL